MSYSIEIVLEVWDDEIGNCVQIGPDQAGLGLVEIRGLDRDSQIVARLALATPVARLVAQALLACADELEKQEKGNES